MSTANSALHVTRNDAGLSPGPLQVCAAGGFGLALLLVVALVGCATPPKQVNLVWPLAPETPRIRYVRSISSLKDLGRSGWTRLKEQMFGAELTERLVKPYGITTDSRDRLYVSDTGLGLVFAFDFASERDGEKVVLLGMKKPGRLARPVGLAVDAHDNLYVSDAVDRRIVVFGPDHRFLTSIGGRDRLERPAGISIDEERQRLYVVDVQAHNVKVYTLDGQFLLEFGTRGTGDGQFNYPTNVAVDGLGKVYVVDSMNSRVLTFNSDGQFIRKFGQVGRVTGSFARPKGIALDSNGHIYVVDAAFDNVQIFTLEGQLLLSFGEFGTGPGEFQLPAGIWIDGHDTIYVSDQYNRRVQMFQYLKETPAATGVAGNN